MPSLILTRADDKNRFLQQAFEGRFETIRSMPLLGTEAIDLVQAQKAQILALDSYDQIIFISENAVLYGLPLLADYWPQWPIGLQFLAVGPTTGAALHKQDPAIRTLVPALASSEGLLALPELAGNNKKVLIVRGVGGRETLKETLVARGNQVDYLEVYKRVARYFPRSAYGALPAPVLAVVYSHEALDTLQTQAEPGCLDYELLVPSTRLQRIAYDRGFRTVLLAKSQADADMKEAIEQWFI